MFQRHTCGSRGRSGGQVKAFLPLLAGEGRGEGRLKAAAQAIKAPHPNPLPEGEGRGMYTAARLYPKLSTTFTISSASGSVPGV
jgi:hypothetical protein